MLDCGSDLDLLPQQPALLVDLVDGKFKSGIDRLNIDRQPTGEIEDGAIWTARPGRLGGKNVARTVAVP